MNQSKDDSCLACVLAMIVGESEQYVLDWFQYIDTPYNDEDAFIFLAHHGFYLALYCKLLKGDISLNIVNVKMDLSNHAVYFIVESERFKDKTHAIYWDGNKLYDPNKDTKKTKIQEYDVIGFYPIMRTEERTNLYEAMK